MSALIVYKDFVIVPKTLEKEFINKVVNGYFDTTITGMQEAEPVHLTSELKISDQMVDMMYQVLDTTKEEMNDPHMSEAHDFDYYMHDLVLVLERLKLSYQLDGGVEFCNMPAVGIW